MTTGKNSLEGDILDRAGLQPIDPSERLPITIKFLDGAQRGWEMGKPHPTNPSMQVYSIFRARAEEERSVPGEARIYVIPLGPGDPFGRYVVTLQSPGFSSESMSYETFVGEVADELQALAVEKGFEECPNEQCTGLVSSEDDTCHRCKISLVEDEADGKAPTDTLPAPPEPTTM